MPQSDTLFVRVTRDCNKNKLPSICLATSCRTGEIVHLVFEKERTSFDKVFVESDKKK